MRFLIAHAATSAHTIFRYIRQSACTPLRCKEIQADCKSPFIAATTAGKDYIPAGSAESSSASKVKTEESNARPGAKVYVSV